MAYQRIAWDQAALVEEQGVFAIASTDWSKSDGGRSVIAYDAKTLVKDGKAVGNKLPRWGERNACAPANSMKERIGVSPDVQPVVVKRLNDYFRISHLHACKAFLLI